MKKYIYLLLLLSSFYTISCASPQYVFLYATTTQSPVTDTSLQYQISQDSFDVEMSKINFEISLDNASNDKIIIPISECSLIDDDNCKFNGRLEGENKFPNTVELYPHTAVKFIVAFQLPTSYDWSKIGSIKLNWSYQRGQNSYSLSSKFLRHLIYYREIFVEYPYNCIHCGVYWSWGFGPRYHHCH